jgi:hypothetical protein
VSVPQIKDTSGERLVAMQPAALRKLIGPEVVEKAGDAELVKRDVLLPRSNGRRARQLRLPGGNVRRSYYMSAATRPARGQKPAASDWVEKSAFALSRSG